MKSVCAVIFLAVLSSVCTSPVEKTSYLKSIELALQQAATQEEKDQTIEQNVQHGKEEEVLMQGLDIRQQTDSLLIKFTLSGGDEANKTDGASPSLISGLLEKFNDTVLEQILSCEEFKDFATITFSRSKDFRNTLMREFITSVDTRKEVLLKFTQLQSEDNTTPSNAILKQFTTSADFRETLLKEFDGDMTFAFATLQEWTKNTQFRNAMLQQFIGADQLESRAKALLAQSSEFATGIAHHFLASPHFRRALVQHFATTKELLNVLLGLFATSPEFSDVLLEYFVKDEDFRDSVFASLSNSQFIVNNDQFKVLFLQQLVSSKQYRACLFKEFTTSPQFQAATLLLLSDVEQFKVALVERFAQSERFTNTIGTSENIVDAALEKFGESERFREEVMEISAAK